MTMAMSRQNQFVAVFYCGSLEYFLIIKFPKRGGGRE